MLHLTLVRHGQANSDARDESSYDQLSVLGHQQARWLGAHFTAANVDFDQIYCALFGVTLKPLAASSQPSKVS